MAKPKQPKDNSTLFKKLQLRRSVLAQLEQPFVLETHGGYGKVWQQVYAHIEQGVVLEKDPKRTGVLAQQRPTWAVYEGDCVAALREGAGSHLAVNLLDVDPYGEPWSAIEAFLMSDRPHPATLRIVVNDGLRGNIKLGKAWAAGCMESVVEQFGNDVYRSYLDICKILMHEKAAQAGYTLSRWHGYYCGKSNDLTHYWAVLEHG